MDMDDEIKLRAQRIFETHFDETNRSFVSMDEEDLEMHIKQASLIGIDEALRMLDELIKMEGTVMVPISWIKDAEVVCEALQEVKRRIEIRRETIRKEAFG